jgi:hypothetical protein
MTNFEAIADNWDGLVPTENLEVYAYVHLIENGLREVIIAELGRIGGGKVVQIAPSGRHLEKV